MGKYVYELLRFDEKPEPRADLVEVEEGVYIFAHKEGEATRVKLADTETIGAWDENGEKLSVNLAKYEEIRPLGNEGGYATGILDYPSFAGVKRRMLGDETSDDELERLYPEGEVPFGIEIKHKYFESIPGQGWGFRAEIIGGADSRDPSVRSVGAYDDEDYETVLWPTTGGFIRGTSDWQRDETGKLIEVWYTNSWDGYRLEEKRTWYVVLLWASVWEGKATLEEDEEGIKYLFWDKDQSGGEIEEWESGKMYHTGAIVTHTGATWESTVDNNHWEPGVVHSVWVEV